MKSIGRLLRGELYKLWKSKILIIMTSILLAVIVIMSAIYANYDKQVSGMLSMLLGGEVRVTSFDLLDGSANDLLKEAGISPESLQDFQKAFDEIQKNPDIKTMLVTTNPVVLQEMAKLSTPTDPTDKFSAPIFGYLAGHADETAVAEIYGKFKAYGSFAPLQQVVAKDYLTDYIDKDRDMNDRIDDLIAYLINGGEYGKTVVGYIEERLVAFYEDYNALVSANKAYEAASTDADKDEAYEVVLGAFYRFATEYSSIKFFTKSNIMSTNFLLIPTEGMMSSAYQTFSKSLEPFESNVFKDSVTSYSKVLSEKFNKDAIVTFKDEFLKLLDPEYVAPVRDKAEFDRGSPDSNSFMIGVKGLISSIDTSATSVFSYNSGAMQSAIAKAERGEILSREEQSLYDQFKTEEGELDAMLPAKKLVRSSYIGEITQEVYESQLKPYYDDKEKPLIVAARERIESAQTRYSDAQLIYGLFTGNNFGNGLTKEQYTTLYSDYESAYKEYAARTSTVKNLVVNVNLYETIEANNLNDQQAKKIQGFMMSSRYNLRSEVTKAQYLISSNQLSNEFVVPETLESGWGAMQFVFVLSSIVILVFGIVLAAGAIAGEHSGGTMKLLLIRPHRRWHVLIAKFLSVLIVIVGMFIVNYLFTFAIGGIFWGLGSLPALAIVDSTHAVVYHPAVVLLLQHVFAIIEAVIFAQISLTLSTVIKSRSGAVSVSMLVYFLSFILSTLLGGFAWYKFIIFNNTNLKQYIASTGPSLADMTMGFSIIVDIVYIAALAVIGFLTFAKRDAT